MSSWTITRNDTAFKGYSLPAPKGATFLTIVRAERAADKFAAAYGEAPTVTVLDPESENDFLNIAPVRVETY